MQNHMKILTIVRHGKAEAQAETDYLRPLSKRGLKQCRHIASALKRLDPPVDLIVSSPALRAKTTAESIAEEIAYRRPILWQEEIYAASADALLRCVSAFPEDVVHVLMVGHNPGLEQLVSGLCAGSPQRPTVRLATAALVHIELQCFWWNQVRWGSGALQLLLKPKVIRKK